MIPDKYKHQIINILHQYLQGAPFSDIPFRGGTTLGYPRQTKTQNIQNIALVLQRVQYSILKPGDVADKHNT